MNRVDELSAGFAPDLSDEGYGFRISFNGFEHLDR